MSQLPPARIQLDIMPASEAMKMVSPTMTKDVGDQLRIRAFLSCSRCPPAEPFWTYRGNVCRQKTQLSAYGFACSRSRRRISSAL
jgi:uncharacterized membrane-anchored protein